MGSMSLGLSKSKSKSKTSSSPAQWVEDASKRGVGYAERSLNQGFDPYGGQRVANLGENEQRALSLAGGSDSAADYGSARGVLGEAAGTFRKSSADNLDKFMDPYRKNVLDFANKRLGETYGRERQALQSSAAPRGAFGGSRQAILEGNLTDNFLQNQAELYQKGLSDSFGQALGASAADLSRQGQGMLQAGQQYGALGGLSDQARAQQIEELLRTGAIGRGVEQAGYDANYGEYVRGQDYENEALDRYLASLRAGDYTRTGTGSTSGTSASLSGTAK